MNASQIRGTVDQIAAWAYWIAALGILALFVVTVLRQYGITIPAVPRLDGLNLLYLAGAAYLLKR